ncbi:MAG: alpha/beta fold hydrolase [Thermomicrobiales bacterium]
MTEQEHSHPSPRFPTPRQRRSDPVVLPDLDLDTTLPASPPRDDAVQFEHPRDWESTESGEAAEREAAPLQERPASPRMTPRAGGSLFAWRYGADAWRLNQRLTRRQADLVLRVRSARAIPASLQARFSSMGLPDDVVDETLGSIRSLDAWADAWIETAQRYLGDFRRQVSAGNQVDGARNQAMAALCYHVAQIVTDPRDRRTATMCRAAAASLYTRALPYVHPTVTRVEFPWRAKSLPGYLHIPVEGEPGGRYGLVVILNGASSSKEEALTWAGPFMRAGLAVLALDSPGTGEAARTAFAPDQDDILDGVFDLLAADPRMDLSRTVVVGISLGGNQAIRCAAYDRRIAGVVAVTAPVEPERWAGRISPLLGEQLMAMTGQDASSLMSLARDLDLAAVLPKVACPVLVIGAGRDVIVPPGESQRLAQSLGALATLDWFGSAGHCVYDHIGTWTADVARWTTAVFDAQNELAAPAVNRAEASRTVAAVAREALLASPNVEQAAWEDDLDEGARLLDADEILDDDPDWYRPVGEASSLSQPPRS